MAFFKPLCMMYIYTVMCCIYTCVGQIITIFDHQQDDTTMSCTRGLLIGYDEYLIKAKINCWNNNITTFYMRYSAKNQPYFTFLCLTDLKENLHKTKHCHFNITTVDRCAYDIELTLVTDPLLSEARLHGVVITLNNDKVTSNEITLPKLYNVKSSTGHLIVNGKEVQTERLDDVTVTGRDLVLVFVCECEAAPCWIEISADDSAAVQRSNLYALYTRTFDRPAEFNVTIKHAACRLDREYNILMLTIKTGFLQEVTEMTRDGYSQDTIIVLGVLTAVLGVAVVILIGLCCHYKRKSEVPFIRNNFARVSFESNQDTTDPRISALELEINGGDSGEAPKETAKILPKETKKMKSKPIGFHLIRRPQTDDNLKPTNGQEDVQVNSNMSLQLEDRQQRK